MKTSGIPACLTDTGSSWRRAVFNSGGAGFPHQVNSACPRGAEVNLGTGKAATQIKLRLRQVPAAAVAGDFHPRR